METLLLEPVDELILKVTLNRPSVRNAINSKMMLELRELWRKLIKDPSHWRCIILTGCGDRAFCAGADLKERKDLGLMTWKQQHSVLQEAMQAMVQCPVPIIAAVNGAAFGGGLELALASDFIYAAKQVIFAQSETKLGIMPGAMGTQNLPRACGLRRAKELTYTAESFTAEQAFTWGLVNQLCEPNDLLSQAIKTANKITKNAPIAVQHVKKSINASQHMDILSGYAYEVEAYNPLLETEDRIEGINAFNEKRDPRFKGK